MKMTEMGSHTLERMREIADRVSELENRARNGEEAVKGLSSTLRDATGSLEVLANNSSDTSSNA